MKPEARLVLGLCAGSLLGCSSLYEYPDARAEACDGGLDEDYDGLTDCADPDCASSATCVEGGDEASCSNGRDDDLDGLADCDDPGCDGRCAEQGAACFDGRDNDRDLLIDGRDLDCWSVAGPISFERCATVEGGKTEIGAELGIDWYASSIEDLPSRVEIEPGRMALIAVHRARVRSTIIASGARDGTSLSMGLVFRVSTEPPLPSGFPEIVVGVGPPDAAPVEARVRRVDCGDGNACLMLSEPPTSDVPNPPELPVPGSVPSTPDRFVPVELTLAVSDSITIRVALPGGPASSALVLSLPPSWTDTVPLAIEWRAEEGAGVEIARIERNRYERCGTRVPETAMQGAHVQSAAWTDGGDLCLLAVPHDSFSRELWASHVIEPGGALASFERMPPSNLDLVAIAWDPVARELRGISQRSDEAGPFEHPFLASAPACAGPWELLSPAMSRAIPDDALAVGYAVQRTSDVSTTHSLVMYEKNPPSVWIAQGDGTPRSLERVPGYEDPSSSNAGGFSVIGSKLLRISENGAGELTLLAGSAVVPAPSVIATFGASQELGAFDRFGVPGGSTFGWWRPFDGALVMDPAPAATGPWHGLLFYSACSVAPCEEPTRSGSAWVVVGTP